MISFLLYRIEVIADCRSNFGGGGGLRGDTHCSSRFIGKLVVDFQFLLVIIELNFFARCYG